MKQIINGKRYDTEKADEIGNYYNGLGNRDFRNINESLYLTLRSKRFFLAGEGGAMTKYSESYGNMSGAGSGIIPLSNEEALSWAEEHLDSEEYEEFFTEMIEDA